MMRWVYPLYFMGTSLPLTTPAQKVNGDSNKPLQYFSSIVLWNQKPTSFQHWLFGRSIGISPMSWWFLTHSVSRAKCSPIWDDGSGKPGDVLCESVLILECCKLWWDCCDEPISFDVFLKTNMQFFWKHIEMHREILHWREIIHIHGLSCKIWDSRSSYVLLLQKLITKKKPAFWHPFSCQQMSVLYQHPCHSTGICFLYIGTSKHLQKHLTSFWFSRCCGGVFTLTFF